MTTLLAVPAARGLFHRAIAQSPAPAAAYTPDRAAGWAASWSACSAWRRRTPSTPCSGRRPTRSSPPGHGSTNGRTRRPPVSLLRPGRRRRLPPGAPAGRRRGRRGAPRPAADRHERPRGNALREVEQHPAAHHPARLARLFARTDPAARDRVLAAYPGYLRGGRGRRRRATMRSGGRACGSPRGTPAPPRPSLPLRPRAAPAAAGGHRRHARGGDLPVFGRSTRRWPALQTAAGGRAALRAVSARMQAHWVHFARHGVPGPGWPAYDTDRRPTLIIDETDRVEDAPRADRRPPGPGSPTTADRGTVVVVGHHASRSRCRGRRGGGGGRRGPSPGRRSARTAAGTPRRNPP